MSVKSMVAGLAIAVAFAGSAQAACTLGADATAGQAVLAQCKACHVVEAGKPSRPTGPNIHDVFGRKAASIEDFTAWSEGIKAAAPKITWDEKSLDGYLADPKAYLNGVSGQQLPNKMSFALKDEAKRKQLIAYLKESKGNADCK